MVVQTIDGKPVIFSRGWRDIRGPNGEAKAPRDRTQEIIEDAIKRGGGKPKILEDIAERTPQTQTQIAEEAEIIKNATDTSAREAAIRAHKGNEAMQVYYSITDHKLAENFLAEWQAIEKSLDVALRTGQAGAILPLDLMVEGKRKAYIITKADKLIELKAKYGVK
jgi:hypothetical protein